MRICIFGAGAIGGFVAARLAAKGETELSLIARGPHLEAMQTKGLRLIEGGEDNVYKVRAEQDPAKLGQQDYVFLALKAHSVPGVVEAMQPLLNMLTWRGRDRAEVAATHYDNRNYLDAYRILDAAVSQ